MKFSQYFLCILILAIVPFSCQKDTTLRVAQETSKLVLHSLTTTGEPISIFISKSANVLDMVDREDLNVPDAKVLLYVDEKLIDSFEYKGPYTPYAARHGSIAQAGVHYRLTASAAGLEPVDANTYLKNDFPVFFGSTMTRNLKQIDGQWMDEVRIAFTDPPGVANFYHFKVLTPYYNGSEVAYYSGGGCIYTNDPDVDDGGLDPLVSRCNYNGIYINDKNFDGRKKELVLFVPVNQLTVARDPSNDRLYYPLAEVTSITEDYYRYRRSIDQYEMASDNPFAEPVSIFSNIRNGLGVFAVSHQQTDSIRF